ncbi:MAG: hypothetical protein JNJ98_01065 [Gemmatimonadetes bacterium]|nr:hypothetical protein [Gemmatimonadota bacterium]
MAFSHAQYDLLERAVAREERIAVVRRGVTWIIVAQRLEYHAGREILIARHPSTGDPMSFSIDDIERIEVIR